jgi:hypothetical protein
MVEQGSRGTASGVQLVFEFGDTAVGGGMQAALDQVAAASKQGVVTFSILARETEVWDPAKRDALLNHHFSPWQPRRANGLPHRNVAARQGRYVDQPCRLRPATPRIRQGGGLTIPREPRSLYFTTFLINLRIFR